jgi:hypothetical protein
MVSIFWGRTWIREFVDNQVKLPILLALNLLADRIPAPTLENTARPNTHILIDIRDEFFKYEENPGRHKAFKAIWNFFIYLYECDGYYQQRIDWVIEKLRLANWEPRAKRTPDIHCWTEWRGK